MVETAWNTQIYNYQKGIQRELSKAPAKPQGEPFNIALYKEEMTQAISKPFPVSSFLLNHSEYFRAVSEIFFFSKRNSADCSGLMRDDGNTDLKIVWKFPHMVWNTSLCKHSCSCQMVADSVPSVFLGSPEIRTDMLCWRSNALGQLTFSLSFLSKDNKCMHMNACTCGLIMHS